MFEDSFYQIDLGEAFTKSACMTHERAMFDFFSSMLTNFGYVKTHNFRIWQRGEHKVVVCFADDFGVCRRSWSLPPDQWFDNATTIITDNHVNFSAQYVVKQMPASYFGVFGYTPSNQEWNPLKRFNFSVNRLDDQRLLILLELLAQTGHTVDLDLINFNCWDPAGNNSCLDDVKNNFDRAWHRLALVQSKYQSTIGELRNIIPIRNHNLTIEQAHVGAWVNVVIETYAGDHTIAFSEKIFRALVTPAPWTVYSARYAVDYLIRLGFDVMADLVDHSYNTISQDDSPHGIVKIESFIASNLELYSKLQNSDFTQIQARCQQAATHNQRLLQDLRQRWPADFAGWLPDAVLELNPTK